MIFGQTTNFAIEAYHEPSGPEWGGFGRMCIHIQGMVIGDLRENHCSLFHATSRFSELRTIIETLWEPSFVGRSDVEIFDLLNRALYQDYGQSSEQMAADWECLGEYVFLTNTSEQFDDSNTFIICRPEDIVTIIWRLRDNTINSASCRVESFRNVSEAYVQWFDEQVTKTAPPFFPINPLNPDELASDNRIA